MQTIALSPIYGNRASGKSLMQVITTFARRAKTRAALKRLTDAQLADIGITARQAHAEARKPFFV